MAGLSLNQNQLLNHLELRLQEVPEKDIPRMIESCANLFYSSGAYEKVLGFDDVANSIERAKSSKGGTAADKAVPKSEVEREAATASVDAEIKALEGGKSVAEAKVVGQEAEEEFYKKRLDEEFGNTPRRRELESAFAKANAVASATSNEWSRVYGQMYGSKHVYERLSEEKRALDAEWGTKQERMDLNRELIKRGLSLLRKDYNSFFGFGGFRAQNGSKIKLGVDWLPDTALTKEEMLEVIRQYDAFGGISFEEIQKAQKKKTQDRLKELKERRKDL